jgi:hypothetical protein
LDLSSTNGERHLERLLDFLAIELEIEIPRHEADHGSHQETGDHQVVVKIPGVRDLGGIETDLLARLAQRRGQRPAVFGLEPPSREADLAAMVRQVRGALRQQHGQAVGDGRPVRSTRLRARTRPAGSGGWRHSAPATCRP